MRIFGSKELLKDVHENDLCIGCGACVSLCPYFKNYRGKTTQVFTCNLPQGRCYAYCPKAEVDFNWLSFKMWKKPYSGDPLGTHQEILAARSSKSPCDVPYQAGGTTSALVAFALHEKMIDAAVLTDRYGLVPIPKLITDPSEVAACAGSKFMASPTLSVLNMGISKGFSRMGVVGTPCQMTAVLQLRSNPLDHPSFKDPVALSIGLFCNWSLDTRRLIAYLDGKTDTHRIRAMDIPPPPADVMVLKSEDSQIEFPLSEIKQLIPNTCLLCPDLTSEFADISVGMYEGRPGWNMLIVRSEKGANLIERAAGNKILQVEAMPEGVISRLAKAAAVKKARALRLLTRKGLLNTEDGEARCSIRIPNVVVEKILREEPGDHVEVNQ